MCTEFAPAKINLSLRVGPLEDDGYHPIDSRVAFADFGDVLVFEPADQLYLEITGPFAGELPVQDNNLILQAARALARTSGISKGARIQLTKNLPVSSGIGGGSADAAATLRGLNRLWDCQLKLSELATIGASFGSDIPACLHGGWLRMRGRGERIENLPPEASFAAVLVNPGIAVSTAQVFGRFDQRLAPEQFGATEHQNDLSQAAISLCPQIADVLQALLEICEGANRPIMCGSGATCLAGFSSQDGARKAARDLQENHPNWWIQPVTIGQAPPL
ncbi:MAG: 4-(cytidine 5'-diphospho)-2-C-methyl-D-erythritol kinase [Robiginitomaculum sp.]|nr:MAG: 4-(cytidine 5'-diphospho)-2-C-methyl-D-erythritol kinase [Robiginitomaculum sp.]